MTFAPCAASLPSSSTRAAGTYRSLAYLTAGLRVFAFFALVRGPGPLGLMDLGLDGALSIAAGLVGIWAGLELVTVSPRRTLATILYALLHAASLVQALVVDEGLAALTPAQLALVITLSAVLPALAVALLFRREAPPAEVTPPRGTPARTD